MIRSSCLDGEENEKKRTAVGRVQLRNPVVFGKKIKPFFFSNLIPGLHSFTHHLFTPSSRPPSERTSFLPSCHHLKQRSSHTAPTLNAGGMKTPLLRSWEAIDDTAGYKTPLSVNTQKRKGGRGLQEAASSPEELRYVQWHHATKTY